MPAEWGTIFKAYDVRGIYPDQLDEEAAYRIGYAFASWSSAQCIVLGKDCRLSSPSLSGAFSEGVTDTGIDVVDIGLATTDMVYFASGRLSMPGAMFTASHNPPRYNGLKLCRPGATPIGEESGLREIRAMAEDGAAPPPTGSPAGTIEHRDLQPRYIE